MRHGKRQGALWFVCLLAVSWILPGASVTAATLGGKLKMTLGQQRVLDVPAPLEQVAIGDPKVLDVKIISQGRQVLVTAIGVGETDLLTWDVYGNQVSTLVRVITKDVRVIRDEILGMLGDVEGVQVRTVGERVIIDGEVYTRRDFERIKRVSKVYPEEVTLLATMSPSVTRLIASEINRSLMKNGYTDVRAEGVGNKIFLEGTIARKEDLKVIDDLSGAYFEECVNLVRAGGVVDDLVLIDIRFMEVGSRYLQRIGITWDDTARFEVRQITYTIDILRTAADAGSMEMEGARQFGANVELLEKQDIARTLAHPRLVCKSGEKAEFVAGGEIPIVLVLQNTSFVQYKKYGIILRISPIVHRDGRISASVEAENSELDLSVSVNDYPGLITRSVDTFVTLDKDKVLTLSGLVSETNAKDVDKVPVIGNFPILGELFKSRSFNNDDTELVIFLTAHPMRPESETNQEMIDGIQEKYDKLDDKLLPHLSD